MFSSLSMSFFSVVGVPDYSAVFKSRADNGDVGRSPAANNGIKLLHVWYINTLIKIILGYISLEKYLQYVFAL